MADRPPEDALAAAAPVVDALRQAETEGQGVWQMSVYGADQVPDIQRAAALGDAKGCGLAAIVQSALDMIANPPPGAVSDLRRTDYRDCPSA
jgi:hypothetical protein